METETQPTMELQIPVSERVKWGRDVKACVVEIDCRVALLPLPGDVGLLASQGVHRYKLPRTVLPLLQRAYVRTAEDRTDYKWATEKFERERERFIDDDHAVQKYRQRGEADELKARIKELHGKYGNSPEGFFQSEFRRGLPPFERVTVIEDDLDNPDDVVRLKEEAERLDRERQLRAEEIAAMSAAVARAVAESLKPLASTQLGPDAIAAGVTAALGPVLERIASQTSKKG